ncbi:acetylesterase [Mycetocola manganoxydans]|uniref:Acetylesterase n=2 Tax=Mycetocola manganoxydans TaxID=699879 RepID=A0A3L7A042_9MICO|nr:acetylesterase [Mycetocola manganoxydans]GHD41428.1 acetylxylan esterase [Mycetocola manganoxydans]
MYVDMPAAQLPDYRSSQVEPDDFDSFWDETIAAARAAASAVVLEPVDSPLATIDVFDVTFSGFDGQPVKAWLRVPKGVTGPLSAVVHYVGYGGGRGHHLENLLWASAGFAHFQMDTRGQGSGWSMGATPDPVGTGPQYPGVMTRGIDSRESYYYRRLFTDAVRAIDTVRELAFIDPARVSVFGQSQGGGIALAVAGLVPDLAAIAPCVPFLCDFPRATVITDAYPYKEIRDFLAVHRDKTEAVAAVLPYFDGVNFARRAQAPALFSASQMDATCPPSTIYGAYNLYAGEKSMSLWQYNGHEGGGIVDEQRAIAFFRTIDGNR